MIELENDETQAKQEMISRLRKDHIEGKRISESIDEFEQQSLDDNAKYAIWWYTKNSIICRSINEAFVSGHIPAIYSYRYIIKLICQQLKDLHQTYKNTITNSILHLYRGQRLKLPQILLISRHTNDLISLNSFVSTTLEPTVARRFCLGRLANDDEAVIFEIDIDMASEQNIPFADIRHLSNFPYEEEILISVGSVFRVNSVNYEKDSDLYRIHLSLSQHDQLTVNKYIEQTFAQEIGSIDQPILFGKLLFEMGEYQFAIDYYKNEIDCLSDKNNHYRAVYLNNIGVCYNEFGKRDLALTHYKWAIQIYKQKSNRHGLGACYHNVSDSFRFLLTCFFFSY